MQVHYIWDVPGPHELVHQHSRASPRQATVIPILILMLLNHMMSPYLTPFQSRSAHVNLSCPDRALPKGLRS